MTKIKLTKRYPNSRTEDITDAYMRGWNDALDAVQNGKFHIAEQTEPSTERIKTLDYCDICNHKGCDNCIANNLDDYCVPSGYAPKDTPQTDCETCRHYKLACELFSEICKYEPKTELTTEDCSTVEIA